jgi:glycosyltransferase involved in cell wall biosynthesis
MRNNQIAAVIPAFNESISIGDVVKNASKYIDIIVVDDGSIDNTEQVAKINGAIIVKHHFNEGYEKALSSGLDHALLLGYKYAITLDADGQHNPEIINLFIERINQGDDLVIGVRDRFQRYGEKVFSFVGKKIWKITDPLCGMKAYNLELLKHYGPFDSLKGVGAEFSIKLSNAGIKFSEVNLVTKPRLDSSRYGSGIGINVKIIFALLRLLFLSKK